MNYIIAQLNGWPTCKKLAEGIGIKASRVLDRRLSVMKGDKVIRWGAVRTLDGTDDPCVFNKSSAIMLASNKQEARMKMMKDKVPCPKTSIGEAPCLPCIGRPSHHHSGRRLFVCNTEEDVRRAIKMGATYFSEIFHKTKEFRVHVGSGKIIIMHDKNMPKGAVAANQAINHVGWTVVRWGEYNIDVCRAAMAAIDSVGLDFGAVDVMLDEATGKASVCEVNTAPTLDGEYELGRYVSYFKWLLTHKGSKWNWKKFKEAKSLAWKSEQFDADIPEDKMKKKE